MNIVVATKNAGYIKSVQSEDIEHIYVKDNMRSIKRLLQIKETKTVLLRKNTFLKEKTSKYIKQYKGDITNQALCIIDKILASVVNEYHLSFPLKEIFVMTEPLLASQIIFEIKDRARLFTVVSPFDTLGERYDKLYFEYGTVIRHIPLFNNPDWENSLVIKLDNTDETIEWIKCPVISFDDTKVNNKTLLVRGVCVNSEETKTLNEVLSINGGLESFCVLGQMPDGRCTVNIKENSGKIYTL